MAEHNRRSFLKWATHGLGVIFAALIGVPAVAYLIDGRNRSSTKGAAPDNAKNDQERVIATGRPVDGIDLQELQAAPVAALPVIKQGVIRAIRRDAWTLHPNDVIGRIWVVKHGPGARDIRVFTTICPHLGCSINCNTDRGGFTCPCHGGKFALDGKLQGDQNPAPRGMDDLNWAVDPTNPAVMLVEYKNFRQGAHDRVEKT